MNWNFHELEAFFKKEAFRSEPPLELFIFDFEGPRLRYALHVDVDNGMIAISADTMHPFSSESLYEFYLHCDTISVGPPLINDHRPVLCFWRGAAGVHANLVLTIFIRMDGELCVWPRGNFSQKPGGIG